MRQKFAFPSVVDAVSVKLVIKTVFGGSKTAMEIVPGDDPVTVVVAHGSVTTKLKDVEI